MFYIPTLCYYFSDDENEINNARNLIVTNCKLTVSLQLIKNALITGTLSADWKVITATMCNVHTTKADNNARSISTCGLEWMTDEWNCYSGRTRLESSASAASLTSARLQSGLSVSNLVSTALDWRHAEAGACAKKVQQTYLKYINRNARTPFQVQTLAAQQVTYFYLLGAIFE